jgi:hypothetical protein
MTATRRKPSPTVRVSDNAQQLEENIRCTFRLDATTKQRSLISQEISILQTPMTVSGQEACALLGISSETFKARLFRARRELLDQAQRALLARIHKTTPSGGRILKNVDDPRVFGNLNP